MTIRVAYDITCIGDQAGRSDRKSGVYRVTEEIMRQLSQREDVAITLMGICGATLIISALNSARAIALDSDLAAYKFVDVLQSRFGLRGLQEKLYSIYTDESFHKLSTSSPRSLLVRGAFKLLRTVDAFANLDRQRFDLLHSPYHELPPKSFTRGVPRVITIHDLIPVLLPEYVAPGLIPYFQRILQSIQPDDWVICNSEFTRQAFCHHTGFSPDRTFVTPLAAADHFAPVTDQERITLARHRYHIPDGAYFLSIATHLEPRKNLPHLMQCFFQLLAEQPNLDVNLVLVGSQRFTQSTAFLSSKFPELSDRVIFTGYVPDADLSTLYSGATAFIYPSLYEGFGLPVLEAMQCGTPVITSNTTSLPEVAGDAGILVDPQDQAALCQAMLNLLGNRQLCHELSQKGVERASNFSWEKCAADTVAAYKEVIGR